MYSKFGLNSIVLKISKNKSDSDLVWLIQLSAFKAEPPHTTLFSLYTSINWIHHTKTESKIYIKIQNKFENIEFKNADYDTFSK